MSKWKKGDLVATVSGTSIPEMEIEIGHQHRGDYEFELWDAKGNDRLHTIQGINIDGVEDKFLIHKRLTDFTKTFAIIKGVIAEYSGNGEGQYSFKFSLTQDGKSVPLEIATDDKGRLKKADNPFTISGSLTSGVELVRKRLFFKN